MLKIDRENQSFSLLETPTLADVSITERYDLQEFISNSPQAFFKEIGKDLFLLGKEITPSKNVQDRIDLLALDKEGVCYVIELKRGNHKLQLFQAISYAGMVAQWELEDFLHLLDEERQDALSDFLDVDTDDINREQRIILVAEAYDFALLTGTEWLCEQYGVGITCCRISLAKDQSTNVEYLVCSNVYPAPELAKEALPRGRSRTGETKAKWPNWEVALAAVENPALVAHYEARLGQGQEGTLPRRTLYYRIHGKRRWNMHARKKTAYVWQIGRFEGDHDFWLKGLSSPDQVRIVKNGRCISLTLSSAQDFRYFHENVTGPLQSATWIKQDNDEDLEEAEVE